MPRIALLLALAIPTAARSLDAVSPPNAAAASTAAQPVGGLAGERGRWRWPVEGQVLSTFRYGRDPFARGQRRGIRIAAPVGRPVRSACAGAVRFAGAVGTSGRVVSVACGRWTATYLHLAALSVRRGEDVRRGQQLGAVGRSGRPRLPAPHLAFGVRRTAGRWDYVDPLLLLPELPGAPPPALVPPARRISPRPPPALGPTPAPVRQPNPGPLEAPARAIAPRPWPVEAPSRGPRSGKESARSIPLTARIGLAALAAALVAWPVRGRQRRRSQAKRLALTGTRAHGA